MEEWCSPDNKIKKVILIKGIGVAKPMEHSECTIKITNEDFDRIQIVKIGQNDGKHGRILDIVLQTMLENETARIICDEHDFKLTLSNFKSIGCIYEWDAQFKFNLALEHKLIGNDMFKNKAHSEASHRFSKGLKILLSIPINVETPPITVDSIDVSDIDELKSNLYNNLASCYLKIENYERVIALCTNVLKFDENNIKAFYKMGVSFCMLKQYENAEDFLGKVLAVEPTNKAAIDVLQKVRAGQANDSADYNSMFKRMFQ